MWIDEVDRVELVAAVVTLVTAGVAVTADRAGALDVAVRQGASGGRGHRAQQRVLDDVTVVVQRAEHLLHYLGVVAGSGAGVQVVAQAEALQVFHDDGVVFVCGLLGRQALGFGLHLDRGAMFVRARDEQHLVA